MTKRWCWVLLLVVSVMISVMACSSDDDDLAPDSIAGQTYRFTITNGTGSYPATGAMIIEFTTNATYTIKNPLDNSVLDTGTYTYAKTGSDTGEIRTTSVFGPTVLCLLTMTNEGAGTFSMSVTSGVTAGSTAQGTFSQM